MYKPLWFWEMSLFAQITHSQQSGFTWLISQRACLNPLKRTRGFKFPLKHKTHTHGSRVKFKKKQRGGKTSHSTLSCFVYSGWGRRVCWLRWYHRRSSCVPVCNGASRLQCVSKWSPHSQESERDFPSLWPSTVPFLTAKMELKMYDE